MDKSNVSAISYIKGTSINLISKNGDDYTLVTPSSSGMNMMSSVSSFEQLPSEPNDDGLITNNYDVLAGEVSDEPGLVLFVDSHNQIDGSLLKQLGFDDDASFDDIINKELKVVINDDYYKIISRKITSWEDYNYFDNDILKEHKGNLEKNNILKFPIFS